MTCDESLPQAVNIDKAKIKIAAKNLFTSKTPFNANADCLYILQEAVQMSKLNGYFSPEVARDLIAAVLVKIAGLCYL